MTEFNRQIDQLDAAELRRIVKDIFAVLYGPDGEDPDQAWSPDTLDEIAFILARAGLDPHR